MDFTKNQAVRQVESSRADNIDASSSYYLEKDNQLPFPFCALPHRIVDHPHFRRNQSDFFLLVKLARYIALDQTQTVNGQRLKTGWSIPISQTALAERTGYTRQTINEKLSDLELHGFIQTKNGKGRLKRYRLVDFDVAEDDVAKMQSNITDNVASEKSSVSDRDWQSQVDVPLAGEDRAQLKIEPSGADGSKPGESLSASGDTMLSAIADTLIDNNFKETNHPSSNDVGESRQPLSDSIHPADELSQLPTIEPLVQSWLKNRNFRAADRVQPQTQIDQAVCAVEDVSGRYKITSDEAISRVMGLIPEMPERDADGDVIKCLSWLVKTSDGRDFLRGHYPMASGQVDNDQQAKAQAKGKAKASKNKTRDLLRRMRSGATVY